MQAAIVLSFLNAWFNKLNPNSYAFVRALDPPGSRASLERFKCNSPRRLWAEVQFEGFCITDAGEMDQSPTGGVHGERVDSRRRSISPTLSWPFRDLPGTRSTIRFRLEDREGRSARAGGSAGRSSSRVGTTVARRGYVPVVPQLVQDHVMKASQGNNLRDQ